jgi:hypothetical protein
MKNQNLKGDLPILTKLKKGQHVGIRTVDMSIVDCAHYETLVRPIKGDVLILPEFIRDELAYNVSQSKEEYYGIVYPKEKKFNSKLWRTKLIAQELASFTKVSQVVHWGDSWYIQLVRETNDNDLDTLFSIGFNWED